MRISASILTNVILAVVIIGSLFISSTGSLGEYDPFIDWDESGKIDPADFAYLASIYGSNGSTIKNVNVTNFPTEPEPKTILVCQNETIEIYEYVLLDSYN